MISTKTSLALVLMLAFAFSGVAPAHADAIYKHSHWATKLIKGKLMVQGPGYGSWQKRWITVDSKVATYRAVGTSKGPVLLYAKGKKNRQRWYVVQLRWNTGARQNPRSFSKPTAIIRGGRFGALLRVGKRCYDYAWNHLKAIDCKTHRFR